MFDTKSSSESMPVTGVGGAAEAEAETEAAEARTRLLGSVSDVEDIVASAAVRFLVIGGIVPAVEEDFEDAVARRSRASEDPMSVALGNETEERACPLTT
jgi:hypothetical protein